MRSNTTDDANVNLANTSDPPQYQKLSEEEKTARKASNACFYCGKEGRFARNCRSRPPRNRPLVKGQARTRATETEEKAPSKDKEEQADTTMVSRIYQDHSHSRSTFKREARTQTTETGEKAPSEDNEERTNTTPVLHIYQDPQYHIEIPEITIHEVEDF